MQILIASLCFLFLDLLWLGFIANQFYTSSMGPLLRLVNGRIDTYLPAAFIVYVALIGGLLLFAVPRAEGALLPALLWGAAYGFVTYATYDFTNLAVVAGWSWKLAIVDTFWGMTLCALTSLMTVWLTR